MWQHSNGKGEIMFKYTLDEVNQLGEKDIKYGYSYWVKSLEEDMPIMFNSMQEIGINEDAPTVTITAEERVEKESKKGNPYYRLRKVKVLNPAMTTAPIKPTDSDFEKEVLARLDTLTAMITDMGGKPSQKPPEDPVVEDVPETIDLKDIPFGENEQREKMERAFDDGEADRVEREKNT